MIPSRRESVITILVCLTLLLFIMAFQNCSQSLPGYTGFTSSSSILRGTPYPGQTPYVIPSPGSSTPYTTPAWEGTCSNDVTINPMAYPGTDPLNTVIPVMIYTENASSSVAIWDLPSTWQGGIIAGTVCTISGGGWYVAAKGHFNSGFYTDLIWRNSTTGENVVWLMEGTTRLQMAQLPTLDTSWTIQGTGDTNGDGKDDIVWRQPSTGKVMIWQMNGIQTPTQYVLSNTQASGWEIQAVKDFDGDGKADIFWRSTSGSLQVWFMTVNATDGVTPIATAQALSTASVSTNWVIAGVGKMDSTASDIIDILWMNTAIDTSVASGGHDLTVWQMIGATLSATPTSISPIPTTWVSAGTVDTVSGEEIVWTIGGTQVGVWPMDLVPQYYFNSYPAIESGWTAFTYPMNL